MEGNLVEVKVVVKEEMKWEEVMTPRGHGKKYIIIGNIIKEIIIMAITDIMIENIVEVEVGVETEIEVEAEVEVKVEMRII